MISHPKEQLHSTIIWQEPPFMEKAKPFAYVGGGNYCTGVDLEDKKAWGTRERNADLVNPPKAASAVNHYLRNPGW